MTIEISILISIISVSAAVFFGLSNNRRATTEDIEKRTIEQTKMEMKLDEIGRNVSDIKLDIVSTKNAVSSLSERVAGVESCYITFSKRLDHLESLIDSCREGVENA